MMKNPLTKTTGTRNFYVKKELLALGSVKISREKNKRIMIDVLIAFSPIVSKNMKGFF